MDGSTSVLALLALFSLWCFFYWLPRRRIWAAGRLIPGPKALPLVGNALLFLGERRNTFPTVSKILAEFGKVARVWLGTELLVIITDPEDIKCFLGNPRITDTVSLLSLSLKTFFGNSLFTCIGEEWKMRKKMLTPMFHFKKIVSYSEIFGAKAKKLVEKLDEVADGTPVDVNRKLCLCALDSVCETVVGVPSNTQDIGYNDFQDTLYTIANLVLHRVMYPWQLISWLYPLTIDGRKAKEAIKIFDSHYSDAVAMKLAAYRRGDRSGGVKTASGKIVPSFLDMLIEANETQGSILTEQDIQHEVKLMLGAGLLTVSNTMHVILLLIAIHPKWQDALFAEMSDVFADDMTRPVTHEDIAKMPVLDRVIRETLRLFPVVGVLPRGLTEDIALPSGHTLPAGCSAVVHSYFVHRNPENFPEPDKFLPDRWLPGSGSTEHTHAYLPFGAGARRCIGQKQAVQQMKSTISQLVRRFKMATDSTMEDLEKIEMEPLLRLRSGDHQMRLEKREAVFT